MLGTDVDPVPVTGPVDKPDMPGVDVDEVLLLYK